MQKIKNRAGETIVEVLFAMLVITVSFTVICGAVVSAAKVNRKLADKGIAFDTTGQSSVTISLTIEHENGEADTVISAPGYKTGNGYYYYNYEK